MSEFTRMVDLRGIGNAPLRLAASPAECAALARRFAIVSVERFTAEVALIPDGPVVTAQGRIGAAVVQSCAVSGEDLPVAIDEPVSLRFVPETTVTEAEIELSAEQLDEIPYTGSAFDLGEALAQSLALAIDPFAVGSRAEEARRIAGLLAEGASNPFAALKGKF